MNISYARCGPVKADVILAGAPVPDTDRPLAAPLQIAPDVHLVPPGAPVVGPELTELLFITHKEIYEVSENHLSRLSVIILIPTRYFG